MPSEISEHAATLAVDAAARYVYTRSVANYAAQVPPYEELDATRKLEVRESVLGIIWAALGALPDQRHTAWLEGLYCGLRQGYEDDNPYPAEEA